MTLEHPRNVSNHEPEDRVWEAFEMKALTVMVLWVVIAFASVAGFHAVLAQQPAGNNQSAEALPPDVRPETLSRMPQAKREQFTSEEDKQAFDRLVAVEPQYAQPPDGPLGGTATRLHLPVVADAYRAALRNLRVQVEPRYGELAAMIASREVNGEEPWLSHEEASVKFSSREVVEIIRNKQDAKGLNEKDETIIRFGREMFREPKVSSKTFADMERLFGRRGTLAIALTMAHYETNALLYRVYDQRMPPGTKRPFPDVVAREAKTKSQ
jgi:hypothetical protein